MDEYEVDLRDYLRVLWKGKWIVLITFLVAVGTALALSYSAPKQYRTETSLLILPPLAQEVNGEVGGTVFSPETYKRLALSNDLLQEVIHTLYPNGGGPSISSLRSSLRIDIEQTTAKNFPGRFPLYLRATFTGTDPAKIKAFAETWAREFTTKNTKLFLSRTAQSYDYIKQNFDEVANELSSKEEEKTLYQQENPVTVLQAEVTALQSVYNSYLEELPVKRQELKKKQQYLSSLESSLKQEPEYFTVGRGLSKEALWEFISAGVSVEKLRNLPDLVVKDQVLNDTYVSLREQVATTRAEVAAAKAEVDYLEAQVKEAQNVLEKKQAHLVEVESTMNQFDRELKVLTDTYTSLAAKLQEAKIARAETAEPIQTIENPVVPSSPIGPNKKMNVAVAGVLGLFAGVLLAFFAHFLQSGNGSQDERTGDSQPLHGKEAD